MAVQTADIKKPDPSSIFQGLPKETAQALKGQFGANIATGLFEANLNRPEQTNTFGSQSWGVDASGRPTVSTQLAPWEQRKYQDQSWLELERNKMAGAGGLTDQLRQNLSQPISFDKAQGLFRGGDAQSYRQSIEDDLYKGYTRRLGRRFGEEDQDFRQRMAAQGVPEGSEKYNRLFQDFSEAKNDAYGDAAFRAQAGAGAETERMFNQALQGRQQDIYETTFTRDNPFREMAQLMSLNQGPRDPNFGGFQPVGIAPTDVTGTSANFAGFGNNLAVQGLRNQGALDVARLGAGGGGTAQPIQAPRPSSGNAWAGIGGAILGGIGQGIGAGLGSGIENKGSGLFG